LLCHETLRADDGETKAAKRRQALVNKDLFDLGRAIEQGESIELTAAILGRAKKMSSKKPRN
jgi:hypothetical protein